MNLDLPIIIIIIMHLNAFTVVVVVFNQFGYLVKIKHSVI